MIESPMIESPAPSSGEAPIDAKHLSAVARSMYTDGPLFRRKLQHWRPYICPFESLVGYVKDGSQVLDVGCGGGLLLSLLAGLGREFEGVGFDVSAGAIDAASRMARRAATISPNARLSFLRLDFDAAWPAEKVDVVFLIDVLHHTEAPAALLIVDEAQQLTPHEVKTVITRISEGSKIVLIGDPAQIDNPYVDSRSNGLVYCHNRMKGQAIAAHVSLRKGERSKLAELAADLL